MQRRAVVLSHAPFWKKNNTMRLRTIDNFLDVDQRQFAESVIADRAIPSVVDGFKPVQRKIIYVANKLWKSGKEKPMKVFQLGGQVSSLALYVHGDTSMNNAIISMNQTFKNNLPLLEGHGQYGNLKVQQAGAPRYVGTKLSENFRLLYKDFDLLKNNWEEGYEIEPDFFLPIIPTVIVNGGSGIAVGYASNILNRNPLEVVDACLNFLRGKKIGVLKPWLSEFAGTYEKDAETKGKWIIRGLYEVVNSNTVRVTEIPPTTTFEKYEEYLDTLVDKKVIADYENNSSSNADYRLKFTRSDLRELIDKGKLEGVLKIAGSETENLTTLDENGRLRVFDTVEDIVRYFCEYRLTWYEKRKAHMLETYERELLFLTNRARFVKAIIDKKLKVGNVPKADVIVWLDKNKFDKSNGGYEYLLGMPIYSLTRERYEELLLQAERKREEIKKTRETEPKDMYIADLNELKRELKKTA